MYDAYCGKTHKTQEKLQLKSRRCIYFPIFNANVLVSVSVKGFIKILYMILLFFSEMLNCLRDSK